MKISCKLNFASPCKSKRSSRHFIRISPLHILVCFFIANNISGQQLTNEKNKDYVINDSVLIPTRDGASVSLIIVRNKEIKEPQPVVLMFTIYARPVNPNRIIERVFADKGFVGVIANARGVRLSPQEVAPFEHDANDAYDVIDWISKQSWCNGKIGMFGASYEGFAQWAAVKTIHPALKTIIPGVAVGIGVDYPMIHGVFMSYALRWIHQVSNSKMIDLIDFMNTEKWDSIYSVWYKSGRSFKALDSIDGRPNAIFQRWLEHPSYDSFWSGMTVHKNDFSHVDIPVLTITGYFDVNQTGALYYYHEHFKYHKNPNHYLLIGPYPHAVAGGEREVRDTMGGYAIDPVARISIREITLQWFNYVLKDSSRPAFLKDMINYQQMGTNEWRHVSSMRQINNDTLTFYLSSIRSENYFKLSDKLIKDSQEYIRQQVDFTNRDEPDDNYEGRVRSNLNSQKYVSFISEPMKAPLSVNGSFFSDLHLIINKKDLDIDMKLYEFMPDGRYFLLSSYIGRASYAKDPARRQLLKPGMKEIIPVRQTFFTSKQLSKGSRLVVSLGVVKTREYQLNYGSGRDVSTETIADGRTPLDIKWLLDSWIKVPVYR